MTKKPVGKPPRNPDTIRFTIDAYLTPAQIKWFQNQGKTKAGTLVAMIDKGMTEDDSIDKAKVSIEIDGKVRVYEPVNCLTDALCN